MIFTVIPLKLIFEYNGEKFHPNPNRLSKIEWDNWKQLVSDLPAEVIYKAQQYKIQIAENNGFTVTEIWSLNSFEENWKIIVESIENAIKNKTN